MTKQFYGNMVVRRALHAHVIFKVTNLFLAFFFQIIIVKQLRPEEYAVYAILLGVLMSAQTFFTFGLDRAVQRFLPNYIQQKDIKRLRSLGTHLCLIRLISLLIFLVVFIFGVQLINRILPIEQKDIIFIAFAVWFIASILFADGDAMAQSCVAHVDLALVYTFEILIRAGAVLFLATRPLAMTAEMIVMISALTTTAAVIALYVRLWRFWQNFRNVAINVMPSEEDRALDVKRAPRFAAAAYISALSWLTSSPALVRLVAASGLAVNAFSAFSFAQGISIALQKGLPGALLLPSLEPLMVAELANRARQERVYAAMSFTFKVELVGVLVIIIVTALAGGDILRVIARPDYAQYYFVMPPLAIMVLFYTMFRIFEIIGNLKFRQKIFLMLWPLGVFSLLGIYLTAHRWGLLSIIFWPIMEYAAKLGILLMAFRRDGAWSAFDPKRSALLALNAGLILGAAFFLRALFEVVSEPSNISFAFGAIVVFFASIMVLRPLRPVEYDTASMLLPASWSLAHRFVLSLTRP